ncbi:SDR family NAD(P)-dependent oxidoreductase [Candidatus Aquiluna sp. UB-MaderosW2red]|uniref:SDR family NAD(P)-dependent oxidoreductase n=1 Tax=Candidatus Aquiluna sp. UB-MaderosW2red TaxID=1855377 RepID=UPI000875D3DC|nr:SDR family NAD(P)-dependent oxidoreductase [Candidatus Aquiluna sp. UB-MaderosW2red]SCX06276.1 Short-chain dehydrogenase [Candidatus Aquiluna sp. UB-MaderosW2red]
MQLKQKTAIITGASSGLGLVSAHALAQEGMNLYLIARGEERLLKAAEDLRQKYPDVQIHERVLDISNLDLVRSFAAEIKEPVEVLMNNAGLMGPDFSLSIEGIESQMATNHIGHFLLTSLLWKNLEKGDAPKVISLSSIVHRRGNLKSASIAEIRGSDPSKYHRWQRYADTKLACLYFARELEIRGRLHGSKTRSIAAHPGWALTGLQGGNPTPWDRFAQSAEQGARSQIKAVLNQEISGGDFIGPKWEMWGEPKTIRGSSRSKKLDTMQRLWLTSEELTATKFLPLDS